MRSSFDSNTSNVKLPYLKNRLQACFDDFKKELAYDKLFEPLFRLRSSYYARCREHFLSKQDNLNHKQLLLLYDNDIRELKELILTVQAHKKFLEN